MIKKLLYAGFSEVYTWERGKDGEGSSAYKDGENYHQKAGV